MQLRNIYAAQLLTRHLLRFVPPHWSSSFALSNWSCGRLSRICDQLQSRDDLRTRSGASGSPHGSVGRNSRERCEDGADDHPPREANSESVPWFFWEGTVSPRRSRIGSYKVNSRALAHVECENGFCIPPVSKRMDRWRSFRF